MSKTAPKAERDAQADLNFLYKVRDNKSLVPSPDAVFKVSNVHRDYAKEMNKPGVSFAPKPILTSTSTFKTLPSSRTPSQRETAPISATPKKVAPIDQSLDNSLAKAPPKASPKTAAFTINTKQASPFVINTNTVTQAVPKNTATVTQAVPKNTATVTQAVPKNTATVTSFKASAPTFTPSSSTATAAPNTTATAIPKSRAVIAQTVPKANARQTMTPKGFGSTPSPAPTAAKKAAARPNTPANPKTAARAPTRAFTPVSNKSFRRSQS